jgi:hypothetical protein
LFTQRVAVGVLAGAVIERQLVDLAVDQDAAARNSKRCRTSAIDNRHLATIASDPFAPRAADGHIPGLDVDHPHRVPGQRQLGRSPGSVSK